MVLNMRDFFWWTAINDLLRAKITIQTQANIFDGSIVERESSHHLFLENKK